MSSYDLTYAWHSIRDVAISMYESGPAMIIIIGIVLSGVVFFSFKR
ncbi:MAG TPA: hypothetical protein VD837_14815 [Terriglobales bacterium]|nr:hypothetical protein [Terriglobales bacterium]